MDMSDRTPFPSRRSANSLLSVVLPVYNEARVLPELVRRISAALAAGPGQYEIIFVDDGSRDESPAVLDRLAAGNRRVRVVHLSRNFGHQSAVQAGLAHARGDAVVLMDSDLQDAPEALPQFLAQWRAGYDVVYAIRTERKEGLLKRSLFAAFHRFLSGIATVPIPADAGIFGLVDRRVALEILALGECDRYFPGLRSWVGFPQTGIEVPRNSRYDQRPRVSLGGLFRLAKTAIFSFSTFPLRMFYLLGAAAGALFAGLSGYSIFCKLCTDLAIPGWTSNVLIGSFFGALNSLGICVLGEYVIRIYDQVRHRPLYLVDRTVNVDGPVQSGRDTPADSHGDAPYTELLEEANRLLEESPARVFDPTARGPDQPVLLPFSGSSDDPDA
jgi:dolichol-phosphate mannosyltransferase